MDKPIWTKLHTLTIILALTHLNYKLRFLVSRVSGLCAFLHSHTHIHIHTYTSQGTRSQVLVSSYIRTHVPSYIRSHVPNTHVHKCAQIHVHALPHIHTHIHTHIYMPRNLKQRFVLPGKQRFGVFIVACIQFLVHNFVYIIFLYVFHFTWNNVLVSS